jgi:hypothetical protein
VNATFTVAGALRKVNPFLSDQERNVISKRKEVKADDEKGKSVGAHKQELVDAVATKARITRKMPRRPSSPSRKASSSFWSGTAESSSPSSGFSR